MAAAVDIDKVVQHIVVAQDYIPEEHIVAAVDIAAVADIAGYRIDSELAGGNNNQEQPWLVNPR